MSQRQKIGVSNKSYNTSWSKESSQLEKSSSVTQKSTNTQQAEQISNPLGYENIMQLQSTVGNRAVTQLLKNVIDQNSSSEVMQKKNSVITHNENVTVRTQSPDLIQKKKNNTGLPDNLKSGIENLSGMSMDDVKVHYNSDKPPKLGALAYTQGTDIHVAAGQQKHLPHEAWHVVQQKLGTVKPTMQLKNVKINDDVGLEQEADIMGQKADNLNQQQNIFDLDNLSSKHKINAINGQSIQCKVNNFEVDTEKYLPPKTALINAIDENQFVEDEATIEQRIKDNLKCELVTAKNIPTSVRAELEKDPADVTPDRNNYYSKQVGLIGQDEFFIGSGGVRENFEGGHLIGHAFWDTYDDDVNKADSYDNLVPMSRTVNTMTYADREAEIRGKLDSIPVGDILIVTLDINHYDLGVSLGAVAKAFGLTVDPTESPSSSIGNLVRWIPESMTPSWQHIHSADSDFSDEDMSEVEENPLRKIGGKIKTRDDLLIELEQLPIWGRISGSLKKKLRKL